jgi:hypothetical protein
LFRKQQPISYASSLAAQLAGIAGREHQRNKSLLDGWLVLRRFPLFNETLHAVVRAPIALCLQAFEQTLARWVIDAAALLQPLHNLLRDTLTDGTVIHMDETVVQVLKEPGKAPTSNRYIWVQTEAAPQRVRRIICKVDSRSNPPLCRPPSGYASLPRCGGLSLRSESALQ